ncbi:MAG TPA: divalent metal cation transporter [Gemmatimonadales bacterium]|nr:divalent metal cation transporter [Gemmatimonadales bacterium]
MSSGKPRWLEVALGILTGIGGFLEAGSLATAVQAGASYRFQLGWALVLGAVCLAALAEMAGRFAAISQHTVLDAIRDRFGFRFYALLAGISLFVIYLVLASELGGVALALQLATGASFRWWALLVAVVSWLALWKGSFSFIENGVGVLGLVTAAFLVAALVLHPPWGDVARGLLPSLPTEQPAHYWFTAVSIIGASISPYLVVFYSSGAIEGGWDVSHLGINRLTAGVGMSFGATVALGALIVAAMIFHPLDLQVDRYEQIALLLPEVFGRTGFWLFVASLAIACFGAGLELALSAAYTVGQGLGWRWSKDQAPAADARFSTVYTLLLPLAALPIALGLDPLKVTLFSMALTAASLPLIVLPFLVLMNDRMYVREYGNGWAGNLTVAVITLLAGVVAVVAIPLQLLGGS